MVITYFKSACIAVLLGLPLFVLADQSSPIENIQLLTDHTMDVDNPAWSPDKKWIAISNIKAIEGTEVDELWLVNTADGSKRRLLGKNELGRFGTYGYSIWSIEWVSNNSLTFIVADNDVDSSLIKLSINSPLKFEHTPRDVDEDYFKNLPDKLLTYLAEYYPEGSEQIRNLKERPYWYNWESLAGKWFVHYLRDLDFLIIDQKSMKTTRSYLSTNKIGDNLRFSQIQGKSIAIYPDGHMRRTYCVDEIKPGQKATRLFQLYGYPTLFSAEESPLFVYTRTRGTHPFYHLQLYTFDTRSKLKQFPTEGWHNLAFSQDGKNVAFIKKVDNRRVLYTGLLK